MALFKRKKKLNKEEQSDLQEAVRLVSAAMEILLPMKKLIEEAEEDDQNQEQQPENMEESEMEKTENESDEEQEDKDLKDDNQDKQKKDVSKELLAGLEKMQVSIVKGFAAMTDAITKGRQSDKEVPELTPLEELQKENAELKKCLAAISANQKQISENQTTILAGLGIAKSVTPTEEEVKETPAPTRTENSGTPPVGNLDRYGPGTNLRKQYGGLSPLEVAQQVRQPTKRLFNNGRK
jgi:hypothetical protein